MTSFNFLTCGCLVFPAPFVEETVFSTLYAAAAKSLQSCLTLCDPMDSSPPGSSGHRILQARILEWVAISFSKHLTMSLSKQTVGQMAEQREG